VSTAKSLSVLDLFAAIHYPETQNRVVLLTIQVGKPSLTPIFKQSRRRPPYVEAIRGQKSHRETGNGSQVKQG
jgi:hypothetical protein